MSDEKKRVLKIITDVRAVAEDNYIRAARQFDQHSPVDMQKEHGQSGVSRAEILEGYNNECSNLKDCFEWVLKQE